MDEMAGKAIGVADELVNDSLDFAPLDRIAITLAQPNDSPGGGGLGNGDSNGSFGAGGPVSIPAKSRENVDEIPSPTDFVEVEKEPVFDMDELYRRIHYPEMARKNGIEGKVVVQVYVDKTGRPVRTQIAMSDNKLLEDAAVNAIMQVRFTPAIQNQIPIGVWVAIPVVFSLK
jgi:TonB family protein